ncbi:unnamed protein product [Paramecium primaurelia]|uniref:HNH endonuclease n=2 Tax=Paramecium TaxID=5884 RepID=A0A8S1USD0_9CILI|nr:unnamed protein product [Paramecium primaurelia]CAD8166702.1 unnamed protein product [Paramecium pentaurelia]
MSENNINSNHNNITHQHHHNQRRSPSPYNPRRFDKLAREECWNNAQIMEGRNPDRWRLDAVGNPICKALNGCRGPLCYQFDHIVPYSKGGESISKNCQLLQSFVNIYKSNKENISKDELKQVSPQLNFTSEVFDAIEYAIYG